jgi:hypothetical protein
VRYAKAFFDLQLHFACQVTILSGMPLERALLEYTNVYVRLGLGRHFDSAHPIWREYLAGVQDTNDPCDWTYRFYLARPEVTTAPATVATFGCFSYARPRDDRIRLHFQNADTDGRSSLAIERRDQRLAELTALFEHVRRTTRQPLRVVGASWLYNLDAYRRLFPASYLASAHVINRRFQHMPLWGQFLHGNGNIKEPLARLFLERLDRHPRLDNLDECFPFQVLSVETSVLDFYPFYGIQSACQ